MLASLRWLRSLLPGLDTSADEIAQRFTLAGLEVEEFVPFGGGLDDVVVASITKVEPHPRRHSLRIVTIDVGDGKARDVVCGAPNVPLPQAQCCFAGLGARLPAGRAGASEGVSPPTRPLVATAAGRTSARPSVVRRSFDGVESEGMLCSEAELGVGDDHAGIVVLPEGTAAPGTPLSQAVPATVDTIFDIGVTPNRPDALGHIGLARELAALFEIPFRVPEPNAPSHPAQSSIDQIIQIEVQDYERCPHYGALAVMDVTVAPSPWWIRLRLSSLGIRPICNIVDITNLVMLEFGHPHHAFDIDRIRGERIVVRRATVGETMTTLDGVERRLDPDDLLICDGVGPIAIAGVMGGEDTEIRPTTRRVLFECACFEPRGIRRTSRRHGLHTESSHRFERGVDRNIVEDALVQAGALASTLGEAKPVRGLIHATKLPWMPPQIVLRGSRMARLLGAEIGNHDARNILSRLGFRCDDLREAGEHVLLVTVPSHRQDVTGEADLIEEVARIRGLDSIPTELPARRPQPPRATLILERRVRQAAIELGLSEAVTYGFVSPTHLQRLGAPSPSVRLLNPLSEERSAMRTTLLPGLLETAARASKRGEPNGRLFTLGANFLSAGEGAALPDERPSFAALLTGKRERYLRRPERVDVYDAKAVALEVVERVTRRPAEVQAFPPDGRPAHLHPRAAGMVECAGQTMGSFGALHPDVAGSFELDPNCMVVELCLSAMERVDLAVPTFRPIPRVPASCRDIALVLPESTPAQAAEEVIRAAGGDLCESVALFDVFTGSGIPPRHRSLAFRVVYRAKPDHPRTLTDQEVDERHERVVEAAVDRLRAALR